jgi:fucose permease
MASAVPTNAGLKNFNIICDDLVLGPNIQDLLEANTRLMTRRTLRWQLATTIAYCAAFVGLGMTSESLGPCLPSLATLYNQDAAADLAPVLIGRGVGYSLGTLLAGVSVERWPSRAHYIMTASAVSMGILNRFIPLASGSAGLLVLGTVVTARGAMAGALDVIPNVLIVHVWVGEDRSAAAMNCLQFSWGLGAFLAPTMVRYLGVAPESLSRTFLLISIISICTGVWAMLIAPPRPSAGDAEKAEGGRGVKAASVEKLMKRRTYLVVMALFLYYFCYAGAEMTPGDWLTFIATKSLGASLETGVSLTSAFWAALTFGRLLAVPVGLCIPLMRLTACSLVVCAGSSAAMIASVAAGSTKSTFVAAVGLGLGCAPLYPAGILLAQTKFKLGPAWISRCVVGSTAGAMLIPAAVGWGMKYRPQLFGWAVAAFVGVQAASFALVVTMAPPPPLLVGAGAAAAAAAAAGAGSSEDVAVL